MSPRLVEGMVTYYFAHVSWSCLFLVWMMTRHGINVSFSNLVQTLTMKCRRSQLILRSKVKVILTFNNGAVMGIAILQTDILLVKVFSSNLQSQYEENEDYLRDSLTHANREREELIDRLSWFQSKVKSQQVEIR